ncbi:hypothetical protein BH23PLA1_BH23PLA1_07870 [soil metagenome]
MPDPASFLQGQNISVALRDVESELDRLWGPAAEQAGGPDIEQPSATRVVLANVILAALEELADSPRLAETLAAITTQYPSRTIVLRRSADPGRSRDQGVSAEVAALCHLPALGRPQVCSERIELSAGSNAVDLLPGAVRPLLEPDLHSLLWWSGDPWAHPDLFAELAEESTRVILDLPDPAGAGPPAALILGLDPETRPHARDLAWFGITPWREVVAQLFDPPNVAMLGQISRLEVRARASTADGLPRASAWLAAWLAGQIGWKPLERSFPGNGQVEATFQGPTGPVAVRLDREPDPGPGSPDPFAHLTGIRIAIGLDGQGGTIQLERPDPGSEEIRVLSACPHQCDLPRVVLVPEHDASHRIAAVLESDRNDPPFRRALPIALWLLGL